MIGQQRYGTICGYGRLTDGEKALGKKRWKDGDGKDDEERRVRGNLRRSVSVAHGIICRVCVRDGVSDAKNRVISRREQHRLQELTS